MYIRINVGLINDVGNRYWKSKEPVEALCPQKVAINVRRNTPALDLSVAGIHMATHS